MILTSHRVLLLFQLFQLFHWLIWLLIFLDSLVTAQLEPEGDRVVVAELKTKVVSVDLKDLHIGRNQKAVDGAGEGMLRIIRRSQIAYRGNFLIIRPLELRQETLGKQLEPGRPGGGKTGTHFLGISGQEMIPISTQNYIVALGHFGAGVIFNESQLL